MLGIKRKPLSMEIKMAVIKALESGEKKSEVAKRFDLIYSSVNSIWCSRDRIKIAADGTNRQAKKIRKPTQEDLDRALLKWFQQQKNHNSHINGSVLRVKADQLANLLGIVNYDCSNGWIDRFKKRHNITFSKGQNELPDVQRNVTDDWITKEWTLIREQYRESDIFNGDEMGLFYRMTPGSAVKFKCEKCVGGKLARERLTIFVCANATGREKRELLVIGKQGNPGSFTNVNKLPVKYTSNEKAWMVANIFEREIRSWDEELNRKGRKIILLLDNQTAHPYIHGLRSIKLIFLPPNTISVLHPMDQGVTRSLRCNYRKRLILGAIEKQRETFSLTNVSLLEACRNLKKAWEDIGEGTINSFIRSGLINDQFKREDISTTDWLTLYKLPLNLENFLQYNEEPYTSAELTDQDLTIQIPEKINVAKEDDGYEYKEKEEPVPSFDDARSSLQRLIRFYEYTGEEEMLSYLEKIDNDLDIKFLNMINEND